ncbi:MAG: SulP family inorganic anion transporter [Bauldia sp.]|nr:SulP family inorganic anion transporter [Bauldia sp.]
MVHITVPPPPLKPSFVELFTPKLVTVLREGYGLRQFRADAIAGLTVAIVALPLSMAIAIASGASPAQGLYTAIIGGFLVSALGGSRFQIGGPAGAFIVLVAATVQQHGMDGLFLAVILSGILLLALGLFRLGSYIRFIPYPVIIGFTAGIAIIIVASQLKDLLGLTLPGTEPGPLGEKLPFLWSAFDTVNLGAVGLALGTIATIAVFRRALPKWPGLLIAVAAASVITALFGLPVATIGSAFGGIPSSLPVPAFPEISLERIGAVLPSAIGFALLGAIESLLSAVVADSMTGRRHRSNCELAAQGVANVASGLFGGISVTGTIARTATNVRAGAHGPVAGILHAAFLLLFILIAAPLASYIPLASLAGVLVVVAWNMVEKHAVIAFFRASRGEAAVFVVTLALTVFRDLTEAIVVGLALGSLLFIHRMSKATAVEAQGEAQWEDRADGDPADRRPYDGAIAANPDVIVYRISGALFFGAAASIGSVLERIPETSRTLILDLSGVPFLDSTGVQMIEGLAAKATRRGVKVVLTGTTHAGRRELFAHGVKPPLVAYEPTIEQALAAAGMARAASPAKA